MTHPRTPGRDWVLLEWTGAVRCPWHGELPESAEYVPGPAACGCTFVPGPGGILLAVVAQHPQHCNTAGSPITDIAPDCGVKLPTS
jgi:hypothetical protein